MGRCDSVAKPDQMVKVAGNHDCKGMHDIMKMSTVFAKDTVEPCAAEMCNQLASNALTFYARQQSLIAHCLPHLMLRPVQSSS